MGRRAGLLALDMFILPVAGHSPAEENCPFPVSQSAARFVAAKGGLE
jgi:hypothetical protein